MNVKLAAISIDLDEVTRYAAIHGLQSELGDTTHAVYDRCVPRLATWLARQSIRATIFAVGEDLERAENRRTIADLHEAGHEIANHSYHHHYDLVRREEVEIRDEIERAAVAIAGACGTRPVGFRAPGYTMSDTVFRALEDSGALYDSSVFPCPTYYAAKATALVAIGLQGRASASTLDSPRVLLAPRNPYRVGRPYWRRGAGLLEIPIGVTRLQLPYIGTSLIVGGKQGATWLTRQMRGRNLINLELHGFDAADLEQDRLHLLAAHRPDLKRTASQKLETLTSVVRMLRREGYELVTLEEAALRLNARATR